MKITPNDLRAISHKTAQSLSEGAWADFLRVIARTSEYSFQDQLLIFAQKPNVTFCTTYDAWTSELYRRMPHRGTGIALLDETGSHPKLRYVFDLSDTFELKGKKAKTTPTVQITAENEQSWRRVLAEKHLPSTQQTEVHIASSPGQFYRSIAFEIASKHHEEIIKKLVPIQHTCDLHMYPEIELERILLNLLTESLSAILQHSCATEPEIRKDFLSSSKLFNSEEAIFILGTAIHQLAYEALQDRTRGGNTQTQDQAKNHAQPIQGRGEGISTSPTHPIPDQSQSLAEALQTPSGPIEKTPSSTIPDEEIIRILQAGPPLEGGKYRLQAAFQNPNNTPEEGTNLLCKEYGVGRRPHMLLSGSLGNLSWGPSGLSLSLSGPAGVSPLTSTWECVRTQLNGLVGQNKYLTQAEAAHMVEFFTREEALHARQRVGAAISALLNIFEPNRSTLTHSQEHIRAYAADNSECARQALAGKLLALSTHPKLLADSDATAILQTLVNTLISRAEDRNTLTASPETNFTHPPKEETNYSRTEHCSCALCKGEDFYTVFSGLNLRKSSDSASVKAIPITSVRAKTLDSFAFNHSIHTYRCAISCLISSQHHTYFESLEAGAKPEHIGEERLSMLLADFTKESSETAPDHPIPSSDHPLCALNSVSASLALIAHNMQQATDPDVSQAGWAALRMFETLYCTSEDTLLATARQLCSVTHQASSPCLPFGTHDAVYLNGVTYDIQLLAENELQLTSIQTGEALPPMTREELTNRIRAQVGSRLIPAWSRDISSQLYQREDQKLLSELLRHFGTWCSCDSIQRDHPDFRQTQALLMSLRVSDNVQTNHKNIQQAADAIERYFPKPDSIPERRWETSRLLSRAGVYLELPQRAHEPEIDHPELLRMDQSRLARSDKVVLADLLHHFGTYQWTFKHNTPELSTQDSHLREEEMTQLESVRVSDSIEENLAHIHLAKTIIARWFLPLDGIRPEILEQQEVLLTAAEQLLRDPPSRSNKQAHTHTYTHTHTDNKHIAPEWIGESDDDSSSHFATTLQSSQTPQEQKSQHPSSVRASSPLNQLLQDAQRRAAHQSENNSKGKATMFVE